MKKLAILVLAVIMGMTAGAQNVKTTGNGQTKSVQTTTIQKVVIQTNGVCEKCENLFRENVPFFKGVKDYSYDSKTSKMTITYDSKKTSPDQLRQQISKLGYNADNVKADAAARAKLPACCQVEKKAAHSDGCDHDHCGHHKSGCSGNHGSCSTHKN